MSRDLEVGSATIVVASSPTSSPIVDPTEPPWLTIAMKELGVRELEDGSNPRIEEYHASTRHGRQPDKVPWQCSFVSWVFDQAKIPESPKSARCADWLSFGSALTAPRRGALVIFAPLVPGSSGHVGFLIGQDESSVIVLAGNVRKEVAVTRYPMTSVRAYRWPGRAD